LDLTAAGTSAAILAFLPAAAAVPVGVDVVFVDELLPHAARPSATLATMAVAASRGIPGRMCTSS
jgi:hypothetical protein